MSLNIKTANGLQEIGKVTKEKVVSALGYTPADEKIKTTIEQTQADLAAHEADDTAHVSSEDRQTWNDKSDVKSYSDLQDAPDIVEDESGNLVITDPNGNIIMKVDKDGLSTAKIKLSGKDLGETLGDIKAELADVKADSIFGITEDESGKLSIADPDGNVIMEVDETGIKTATVKADAFIIDDGTEEGLDVNEKINDHIVSDTHLKEGERAKWDAKSDFSGVYDDLYGKPNITDDLSGKYSITDEAGNVIFEVNGDDDGVTNVYGLAIQGVPLTDFISQTSVNIEAISDEEIIALCNEVFSE